MHYFPIVIVRRRRGILNREVLVPESETMPIYLEYLICSVLYREKVEFRRRGAVEFQTRYTQLNLISLELVLIAEARARMRTLCLYAF